MPLKVKINTALKRRFSVEIRLCLLCYNAAQNNKRDAVRDCHERVRDVGYCPDCGNRHVRSDCNGKDVDPPVDFYDRHVSF